MMPCTLSAPTAYFLPTTVLCARNVSPTAYFLPTAAKSMKKCRQKPSVSAGVLWVLSFAIERKYPAGGKKRKATGNISRRRHVPYEKGPAGRKAPVGDTTQKYSSASEMLPTQKGTCHGTFLFAGHFFGSVVIRLLPCFSFAPQGRGCCWVMQWILPPPKATSRVCTPTTSRSGNISCT